MILARLRPIVAEAKRLGAFIDLDMEHYGLKQLTIDLFKKLRLTLNLLITRTWA